MQEKKNRAYVFVKWNSYWEKKDYKILRKFLREDTINCNRMGNVQSLITVS